MQSYYVDEWEHTGILLEATFTPLAFGGAWLLGAGRVAPAGDARLRPRRLGRGPPLRRVLGPGRARRRGLAAGQLQADRGATPTASPSASPAPPKSTSPPAPPRSTPTSPASASSSPATSPTFEATSFKPAELRLEAFHPMGTARIAADPSQGVCAHRRIGQRNPRSLRGGRLPFSDLSRRQSDDDRSSPFPSRWRVGSPVVPLTSARRGSGRGGVLTFSSGAHPRGGERERDPELGL